MRRLFLRWVINAVAVYLAIRVANLLIGPGAIRVDGGPAVYLWVALILGLVNAIIAPILKALTCPLILLTLGLFTLVINGLLFWLTSIIAQELSLGFYVDGFWAAFVGGLVTSVVSVVLSVFLGVNKEHRDRR